MEIGLFDYHLPKKRIANSPSSPRDHSKLLLISRKTGRLNHYHFYQLPKLLTPNDVLVFNQTKVFPTRLIGKKESGGKIEILLLKDLGKNTWEAIFKGNLKIGTKLLFSQLSANITAVRNNLVQIHFNLKPGQDMDKLISKLGKTPLPPYISSRGSEEKIRKEYQTVYAQRVGSAAAPTAGLHFTKNLIHRLQKMGVQMEYVTLHVGLGTFQPVKVKDLNKHQMHSEYFEIDKKTLERLSLAKIEGRRIIAVGTTSARVLESCSLKNTKGETNIFIYPPYKFKFVDALITNFHLPKSTLLTLVSAFVSSPNTKNKFSSFVKSLVGKAYKEAIKRKYRFYSFGDATLIE